MTSGTKSSRNPYEMTRDMRIGGQTLPTFSEGQNSGPSLVSPRNVNEDLDQVRTLQATQMVNGSPGFSHNGDEPEAGTVFYRSDGQAMVLVPASDL